MLAQTVIDTAPLSWAIGFVGSVASVVWGFVKLKQKPVDFRKDLQEFRDLLKESNKELAREMSDLSRIIQSDHRLMRRMGEAVIKLQANQEQLTELARAVVNRAA